MAAGHDVADVDPHATAEPEATIPVFKRLCAPSGLATKRQLRAMGLRPGGQDPVAEVETRGPKNGLLYEIAKALPVRPMTLAKEPRSIGPWAWNVTTGPPRTRAATSLPRPPAISWLPAQNDARNSRRNFPAGRLFRASHPVALREEAPSMTTLALPRRTLHITALAVPLAGWTLHTTVLRRRLVQARRDPLTSTWRREEFTARAQRLLERHPDEVVLSSLLE
jgi:hypothetical protein